jgi:hypothetical protein
MSGCTISRHRRQPDQNRYNTTHKIAPEEAQATRRVLLANRKLVAKREDLRLQGSTGPKTGGYYSEKGDEKRAHRGSHHDLTNGRNPCVFRSEGVLVSTAHRLCYASSQSGLR